ncbi:MAG: CDP-diacylglycerol--glycerol-3-phosphate 3-phosphatidyltransferase [Actinomycetota bacterium]|jgi:CDP-diacylglycerol--glycerol-3-phosphate 3-phosphatidyltransferase
MKTPGSSPVEEMNSKSFLYRQTPNLITSLRLAMVPIVLWLLLEFWTDPIIRFLAMVILIIAASTDGLDGSIARKRGLITNLGKILDPIADKALLSGTLIVLSILGAVSWFATVLILFRELGITLFRLVVIKKRVIAADGWGKFKTVMQIVSVCLVIGPFGFLGDWYLWLTNIVLWFTVAITLWSGALLLWPKK